MPYRNTWGPTQKPGMPAQPPRQSVNPQFGAPAPRPMGPPRSAPPMAGSQALPAPVGPQRTLAPQASPNVGLHRNMGLSSGGPPVFQENNMGIHRPLTPTGGTPSTDPSFGVKAGVNPEWRAMMGQPGYRPGGQGGTDFYKRGVGEGVGPGQRVRWRDTQTDLTPEQMAMSPQELGATLTPEQRAERQAYIRQAQLQRLQQQQRAMQGAAMLRGGGSQQRQWDPRLMYAMQRAF